MKIKNKTDIFVIENSPIFSSWIESEIKKIDALNLIGFAKDIRTGLNIILKSNPKIVILDLFLDDGSGLKILRTIKENKLPIKVIVFTNFNFYKSECLTLGSDYFFDKSNDFEELIRTVKILSEEAVDILM